MARLLHAEEALAPTCTCMSCMGILVKPLMLVPCGHTVCSECLKKAGGECMECRGGHQEGGGVVEASFPNGPLEAICSKYEYKLSVLRGQLQVINEGLANSR